MLPSRVADVPGGWVADFVLAVGVLLTVLALGFFTPLGSSWPFTAINNATNTPSANYNLLFVVIGPIVINCGRLSCGVWQPPTAGGSSST